MDERAHQNMKDAPPHAILENAWQWQIAGFNPQLDLHDRSDSYIDLTLRKENVVRRLRFFAPQDVRTKSDIESSSGGLKILDLSQRQMDGIGVHVTDFEMYPNVTFRAREVIDLDVA